MHFSAFLPRIPTQPANLSLSDLSEPRELPLLPTSSPVPAVASGFTVTHVRRSPVADLSIRIAPSPEVEYWLSEIRGKPKPDERRDAPEEILTQGHLRARQQRSEGVEFHLLQTCVLKRTLLVGEAKTKLGRRLEEDPLLRQRWLNAIAPVKELSRLMKLFISTRMQILKLESEVAEGGICSVKDRLAQEPFLLGKWLEFTSSAQNFQSLIYAFNQLKIEMRKVLSKRVLNEIEVQLMDGVLRDQITIEEKSQREELLKEKGAVIWHKMQSIMERNEDLERISELRLWNDNTTLDPKEYSRLQDGRATRLEAPFAAAAASAGPTAAARASVDALADSPFLSIEARLLAESAWAQ